MEKWGAEQGPGNEATIKPHPKMLKKLEFYKYSVVLSLLEGFIKHASPSSSREKPDMTLPF